MTDQTPDGAVDQSQPTAETPEGTQDAPQPGIDLSPLESRLDDLGRNVESLAYMQQQWQAQQQQEDPYGQDPYAQQDPYAGFDPTDPQQMQQFIQQQIQEGIQQGVQPIQQTMYDRDVQDLLSKHPDLNEQSVAQPVVQQATAMLRAAGVTDQNAQIPVAMLEAAYKIHKADQYAAQQTPVSEAQQGQVHLEGAGAQIPAPEVDPADAILGPREQSNPVMPWAQR